jgi:periplasmic protein CpxP/Spy
MIKPMNRLLRLTTLAAMAALGMAASGSVVLAQPVRAPDANANRPALEQQFRQRVAKLAQQRIGLTDAQMAQLQQSNARFAPRLNSILAQERETRRQLRLEMTSTTPNQQHVGTLLDQSLQLQKQRIAVVEEEQKDLAGFMTPVQRARYIALQQQFRRRAQELARQDPARQGFGGKGARPGFKKIR